jgi:hypothetical protein
MAISTADSATLGSDPPFLLRHPRARGSRGFLSFLSGIRAEPPRVMLQRIEPILDEPPAPGLETFEGLESFELEAGGPEAVGPEAVGPEVVGLEPIAAVLAAPVRFEAVPPEPVPFEPIRIETIELPPALPEAEPAQPEEIHAEALVEAPLEMPAVAPLAAPRRSWGRRLLGGLVSLAAYMVASLMLLAAGPVYLMMSDRQDVVRWSNDLLDLLSRW